MSKLFSTTLLKAEMQALLNQRYGNLEVRAISCKYQCLLKNSDFTKHGAFVIFYYINHGPDFLIKAAISPISISRYYLLSFL